MAETRRSFFGTLLAFIAAPFVAKAVAPDALAFHKDAFAMAMEPLGCVSSGTYVHHLSPAIDPWPMKPFAEFPAPIEAMRTIKTNGIDTHLLVLSGGVVYLVDQHGVAKRLY